MLLNLVVTRRAAQDAMKLILGKFGSEIPKRICCRTRSQLTWWVPGLTLTMTVLVRQPVQLRHLCTIYSATNNMTPEQTMEYFNNNLKSLKVKHRCSLTYQLLLNDTGQIGAIPPLYYELSNKNLLVSKTSLRWLKHASKLTVTTTT